MTKDLTISPLPPPSVASDFEALRKAGLAYIERYAHDLWTDYNAHDPGVTSLEMLCYAITDLSLRTRYDMRDLLTSAHGGAVSLRADFAHLTAEKVLPSAPVSEEDYRKLFIDIEGVRNAWLTKSDQKVYVNCTQQLLAHDIDNPIVVGDKWLAAPFALNGLYDILIDFDTFYIKNRVNTGENEADVRSGILTSVRAAYLENRNLCEDMVSVRAVPVQMLMICADVSLAADAQVSEVYAQILLLVQQYLDPPVKRHSLAEMRAKNLPIDLIFEGHLLQHGFITDDDLAASSLRTVVHTSDLIQLIMGISGVLSVRKIRLNSLVADPAKPCGEWATSDVEGQAWCLHIAPGYQAQLCVEKTALAFYKDIIPVGSLGDKTRALARLRGLEIQAYEANIKTVTGLAVPTGDRLDLAAYTSVTNDYPENYGLGQFGLPATASPERKAKAKQMKAYLLFFDQILANYLAQLNSLKSLFSADGNPTTYFGQAVSDMKDMSELFPAGTDISAVNTEVLAAQEGFAANPVRKNRFLDHLLARFGENFNDYALLMFSLFGERTGEEVLQDKAAFLKDYDGEGRSRAYNYCQAAWGNDNISGITRRIARLTGIRNPQAHTASDVVVINARQVSPIGDEIEPEKFRYRVHEGNPDTSMLIYTTSKATFDTAAAALRQGFRDLTAPVPRRSQFEIRAFAKGYKHILLDERTGKEFARSPQFFATEAEAKAATEALLEHLIYAGENIFIVENSLLRPEVGSSEGWLKVCVEPDCSTCPPLDPYSYRVSVVLPGYTTRFRDMNYRRYMERLIRTEMPAHVLARICWVGREQLAEFEEKYRTWLAEKAKNCSQKDPAAYAAAQVALLDILEKLYSIYPEGVLHDCENEDEERPIILGQTMLGTL